MTDILDLSGWNVLTSRLDDGTYTIEAEYTLSLQACPKCGVVGKLHRHGTKVVTYRDSPIRGAHVQLAAKVQRYKCRECGGTSLQPLGGIASDMRMTARCVDYIERQCMRDTFTRIADYVGCDEKTVRNVAMAYVDKFNARYRPVVPVWLGIDETRLAGELRCVLTDAVNRRPVDILPTDSSGAIAQWLHSHQAAKVVRGVASDLRTSFHKVIHEMLPGVPVVADKFHVVRMADDALDTTRRRIGKSNGKEYNLGLKRSKHLVKKRAHNLSEKQVFNRDIWLDNEPHLDQAYRLKEELYNLYEQPASKAEAYFDDWLARASSCDAKADFRKLVGTLKRYRTLILAYFKYPITNGYTESFNGDTKAMARAGRGYMFEVIRVRALTKPPAKRMKRISIPVSLIFVTDGQSPYERMQERARRFAEAEGRCESCHGIFFEIDDLAVIDGSLICQACYTRAH